MGDTQNVGGRDRIVRGLLAAVLTVAAVRSLKRGKRLRGLLEGVGALAFGFNATTGYCGVNDALDVDTTSGQVTTEQSMDLDSDTTASIGTETDGSAETESDGELTCAVCGEPIVPGQRRSAPGATGVAHDDCL